MGTVAVLLCAIDLLGRSASSMPQIEPLALRPADVSVNADGFVRPGSSVIYVITSAPAFRDADCHRRKSLVKLASVLVHEEWHIRHGADERGAYEAQLSALMRLGATPESTLYRSVLRSMRTVLQAQARPAEDPPRAAVPAEGPVAPPVLEVSASR
jgi:hypothetical protein